MTTERVITNIMYENGMKFKTVTSEGHDFFIEPSPSLGGSGKNPNPIDYLTGALGSCTGIKLLIDLESVKVHPDSIEIMVEGNRRELPPTVFENLHVTFLLRGTFDIRVIEKVIHEVMTLNCPVAVMLGKATKLTWEFRIEN